MGLADDDGDDDDNLGGLEMTAGTSEFCLSQDMSQQGMMTAGDSLLNHSVFTGNNLVSQPRKVSVTSMKVSPVPFVLSLPAGVGGWGGGGRLQ